MDYAHKEYEARFGREPRAYGVQTMRYDVDAIGIFAVFIPKFWKKHLRVW